MIQAAELAGETKHGAVLWLHGPQPSFNREMYIVAPYVGTPKFFELPLDDGWTNTNEFLSNHKEIGPFTPIVRNGSVREDLQRFFAGWNPGAKTYRIARVRSTDSPTQIPITKNDEMATALARLSAYDECRRLLAGHRLGDTVKLASSYHLVTKATGAVVLERTGDYVQYGLRDPNAEPGDEVALAQRAQPGSTVLDRDSLVIQGVNTSGTVRVNNLAHAEAMLNILANGTEICGLLFGLLFVAIGFCPGPAEESWVAKLGLTRVGAVLYGVAMMLGGLATPGVINWLVASARDANLFS